MQSATVNSIAVYLLDDLPDWTSAVQVSASLPAHAHRGLSGREQRQALGDTLRLGVRYSATVTGAALPALRNSLQGLTTQPVLCPLWPAMFEAGDSPTVEAAYYLLGGDGDAVAVDEHANLPFARPAWPLLWGRLAEVPTPGLIHDEAAMVEFDFVEDHADYVLDLPAYSPTNGLADVSGARPIWPWRPDWSEVKSGGASVETERRDIGQGRSQAAAHFTQRARRTSEQRFTLTDSEPWNLLSLFKTLEGNSGTVWLPAGLADTRLSQDVLSADTHIHVASTTARGDNTEFLLDDLTSRKHVRWSSTGTGLWNLTGAVGANFDKDTTRLESVILARLSRAELTLHWESPAICTVGLEFTEAPWELLPLASGETAGTTLGSLPVTAYLYKFTIAYPGAAAVSYFTNFERDLTYDSETYSAECIQHDSIKDSVGLDQLQAVVTARMFSGNPIALLIPFTLEWPLQLTITEVDVDGNDAENPRVLFDGEVTSVRAEGPYLQATVKNLPALFGVKVPRRILQPACNWSLFESGCAPAGTSMERAYWKWSGTIAGWTEATRALSLTSVAEVSPNPGHTLSAHYFAGGYCVIGAGSSAQYRRITDSTAPSGGALLLSLATNLSGDPTGLAFEMYPGCDGNPGTCADKFGNFARFGGFPFLPIGNPSMIKISKNVSSGGKK